MSGSNQDAFKSCYRGRRGPLYHAAYMRMGKVLFIRRILRLSGTGLSGKSIFDYGFGAGTFYRYCPKDARLFGVEQDANICRETADALRAIGHDSVDLQPIDIENWREHPLLRRCYDFFLCSHVLEHMADPVGFLKAVRGCLGGDGVLLALVPINERSPNPHHLQTVDRNLVARWAEDSGYEVCRYEENDPFLYWAQPLYAASAGWRHKLAQAVSLDLGLSAKLFGERLWFAWGRIFAAMTFSKPTQAGFILRPKRQGAVDGG